MCLFCKIIAGEIPAHKIYEDEEVFAFLDIHPINPGHTLVVPKAHYANLVDAPPELLASLIKATQKIAKAVISATGMDNFNLGVNNGSLAGQVIFHLHFHIMPRYADDHHQLWHGQDYKAGEAEEIAGKIRKLL